MTLHERAEALLNALLPTIALEGGYFINEQRALSAVLAFAQQVQAQERQRCAERLCAGCRQQLPIKNGWHMEKNGKDTLVNNCCIAQAIREQP